VNVFVFRGASVTSFGKGFENTVTKGKADEEILPQISATEFSNDGANITGFGKIKQYSNRHEKWQASCHFSDGSFVRSP